MIRVRVLAFAAALLAAPAVRSAHADGFEKNLPAGTLAFVGIDDVTAFKAGAAQTAWGRLLADPAFEGMKSSIAKEITAIGLKAKDEVGASPLELMEMMTGGVALALVDATYTVDDKQKGRVRPAFVFLCGVGDKADDFLARVDVLTDREVADGKTVRQNEQEGDVDVRVLLNAKDEGENRFVVRYGVKGDVFIATIAAEGLKDRNYFAETLAGLGDDSAEVLAEAPAFSKSAAARGEGGLRVFGDMPRLLAMFLDAGEQNGELDEEAKKAVDMLGVRNLGVLSANLRMSESGTEGEAELPFDGQGWIPRLAHAFFAPGEFGVLRLAPEKPLSVTAWQLHIGPGMDAVREMLGEMSPDLAKEMDQGLATNFKMGDVDLKKELIDNLTGELGVFTVPIDPDEAQDMVLLPNNFVLMLGLKDSAAVTTAIDAVLRNTGMHAARKKEEFQGTTVWSVPTPAGTARYTVLGDYLVASLSDELLKDTLRRKSASDLPNLGANDEFKAAIEKSGGQEASAVLYWDAQELARGMLTGFKMAVEHPPARRRGTAPMPENPFAGVSIPDPSIVDKHVKGMMIEVTHIDDKGVRIHFNGP